LNPAFNVILLRGFIEDITVKPGIGQNIQLSFVLPLVLPERSRQHMRRHMSYGHSTTLQDHPELKVTCKTHPFNSVFDTRSAYIVHYKPLT
jgi:hypothetical protein